MAAKDRLNGIAYTCANSRFRTDVRKGRPHGPAGALGSVFDAPLVQTTSHSLWLEFVEEPGTSWEPFWLMWYDASGNPTMPMSSVFDRSQVQEMTARLASFIDIK